MFVPAGRCRGGRVYDCQELPDVQGLFNMVYDSLLSLREVELLIMNHFKNENIGIVCTGIVSNTSLLY